MRNNRTRNIRTVFQQISDNFGQNFGQNPRQLYPKTCKIWAEKCGSEALKRIKMNKLGRLLVVEIVKSKFHQIKKIIIKKKRIWW